MREQAGDRDGADHAYQQAATTGGHVSAWAELARLRELSGDRSGAEDAALDGAAVGSPEAWVELARWRELSGDLDGAEQAYQRATAVGHEEGVRGQIMRLLSRAKDLSDVEDRYAWVSVARLREHVGDHDSADRIRCFGITMDGDPDTAWSSSNIPEARSAGTSTKRRIRRASDDAQQLGQISRDGPERTLTAARTGPGGSRKPTEAGPDGRSQAATNVAPTDGK